MALSQNLVQKQTQRLVITQDLRQSIELLPLSNLELSERIQKELLENPLLEESGESTEIPAVEPANPAAASLEQKKTEELAAAEDNWPGEAYDQTIYDRDRAVERTENKQQFLENAVRAEESLSEHLLWQLRLSDLDAEDIRIAEVIVSAIDERGFLSDPLEDVVAGSDVEIERAHRVLALIHELDPVGCGARNIADSLLVQARLLRPDDATVHTLLANHFEDLEKLDFKKIERESGYSTDEIQQALQFVRTLEPYPGTLYAARAPDYIVPDVIVEEQNGDLQILINDDWMPAVRINDDYRRLLRSTFKKEEDKEYLQNKLNSAQWLIKSVRQRRLTLIRVMDSIVEFQRDFFLTGPSALKPLTLRAVAEKVDLHESTISRITTNKYVQTRWGVLELKYFFSSSLRSTTGSRSARSIQDRIRNLVDAEDPEQPLSDQDIVERLKDEGVEIARRTVAKYRKVLKILPGDRRRKLSRIGSG